MPYRIYKGAANALRHNIFLYFHLHLLVHFWINYFLVYASLT